MVPPTPTSTADSLVSAMKQLRKASMAMVHQMDGQGSPALQAKIGSIASYFYAPHPAAGRGACFAPSGDCLLRYGYGPDVKVMSTRNAELITTLMNNSVRVHAHVRGLHSLSRFTALRVHHLLTSGAGVVKVYGGDCLWNATSSMRANNEGRGSVGCRCATLVCP
jgi:hypothetical protein